ncbi:MAG: Zc3h12a-like Ribonuclease domain, partial [Sphingomonadales bacterium]|nr:Zc3h12a-like Ribonuclease domain [Sphingomonadales bacterium]
MTPVILDGSNLALWGQREKRNIRSLGALLPCLRALADKGIEAFVIFDASFRHRIDKKSRAAADFEQLLREDEK